ncbi:hypothetical protein [Pseudomonas carassii]|uniref:Uncharacterized protein n=1 Tax=Pseudomonas carassii TaxID=3115855 RepID=A0ABU7HIW4_9PSED|nr:hypothetical protein [Pseudomonas sp. 137P]MEE1891145.1 hypothetical protein [Pseudomonas sp. 137P]
MTLCETLRFINVLMLEGVMVSAFALAIYAWFFARQRGLDINTFEGAGEVHRLAMTFEHKLLSVLLILGLYVFPLLLALSFGSLIWGLFQGCEYRLSGRNAHIVWKLVR